MSIYEITVKDKNNNDIKLDIYKNNVLLIVNTATHCGFTPQYNELQTLYDKYHEKGLEILDFPCNQFGSQAPEDVMEISNICQMKFGVKFEQFQKIDVNGENEDKLYTFLKNSKKGIFGKKIKWNFTKFLVDKNGNVISRFAPTTSPLDIEKEIIKLL